MKKIVIGVLALLSMNSFAALPDHSKVRFLGNQMVQGGQAAQLGSWIVDHKIHTIKASYSVTRDGGLVGSSVALKGVDGLPAVIPAGAVLKGGIIDVIGAPSPASGTTILSLFAKEARDIMDFKEHQNVTGIIPAKFASLAPVKLIADRNVSLGIAGATLVNGKFNVIIEYYLSDTQ